MVVEDRLSAVVGLAGDPYGELRDEFMQDEPGGDGQRDNYRLCDEARDAIAQFAQLEVNDLFGAVPVDGFDARLPAPPFQRHGVGTIVMGRTMALANNRESVPRPGRRGLG